MPKTEILGIPFQNVTSEEAADALVSLAARREALVCITANAEIAEASYADPALLEAVRGADYIVPDGAGVVLASRILGAPLRQRVAGCDLALELLSRMVRRNMSVYLFGAAEGIAEKAARAFLQKCPGLRIAGIHNGYFQDDAKIVEEINAAAPDFLYVCLGAPKEEFWMHRHRGALNCGVMIGLGGSFDIYAGVAKRAPRFFIRLNLEWFYRLIRQPWRIGRMMRLPKYILRALGAKLTGHGRKTENEG